MDSAAPGEVYRPSERRTTTTSFPGSRGRLARVTCSQAEPQFSSSPTRWKFAVAWMERIGSGLRFLTRNRMAGAMYWVPPRGESRIQ